MYNPITLRFATNGLLLIISLTIVFHFTVLLGIVPFELVWGGRLRTHSQMLSFEAASIAINLAMLAVVAIHSGVLKIRVNRKVIRVALWAMFILFLLNTVGNLLSENQAEKMVFTPVTFLLSVFSLRLAVSKKAQVSY
ncbi:hypothetical protein ABID22_000258 [Pontibacter aydingkolensis]|uniref:Uncharacterized protein n=1 Tax=Pontibacter aydingkolensis TaxID=1911536 RepID=A0ABS7CQG0_9BACT|nr:hypothetical protein [Pontibacter aydingkolensis]MBW7466076.1 hypothetical protein [Pontibacter aydingkolensis]